MTSITGGRKERLTYSMNKRSYHSPSSQQLQPFEEKVCQELDIFISLIQTLTMPAPASLFSSPPPNGTGTGITKLTNCRLVVNDSLVSSDLFISSQTGKIISTSDSNDSPIPDVTIDLHNRIVSPGLIDCQLNGAFGFNFSSFSNSTEYVQNARTLNTKLIRTGVTSYLPTLTSQTPELYHSVLPHLGPLPPSGSSSNNDTAPKTYASESLGAHVEGPFLSPHQHGIHDPSVIRAAINSWEDLEQVYGSSNLTSPNLTHGPIKMITLAPELFSNSSISMTNIIPSLVSRGIVVSLGHTKASLSQAAEAVRAGAKMITHLFNAMRPLHHREPGVFGLLGLPPLSEAADEGAGEGAAGGEENQKRRPLYYGVIADGIHLHPSVVALAYNLHPAGFILVTDAMHLVGMEDGRYEWVNGGRREWIEKRGGRLFIVEPPSLTSASSPLPSPSLEPSSEPLLEAGQNGDVNGGVNVQVNSNAQPNGIKNGVPNGEPNGQKKEKNKWGGIAGSSATLLECVNNLLQWTGMSIPKALASVTSTPAEMLGLSGVKGSLQPGADADLVVFEEVDVEVEDMMGGGGGKIRRKQLVVEEVWKFGVRVFVRDGTTVESSS